jgi:hypothetical protein
MIVNVTLDDSAPKNRFVFCCFVLLTAQVHPQENLEASLEGPDLVDDEYSKCSQMVSFQNCARECQEIETWQPQGRE